MALWFGGLLIEDSHLVWSGGQKATTPEGHNRRPLSTRRPPSIGWAEMSSNSASGNNAEYFFQLYVAMFSVCLDTRILVSDLGHW